MTPSSPQTKFLSALEGSLADDSFVKLTLGAYKGREAGLKNIHVRQVRIKRQAKLSFTYRYQTRDIVKNHAWAEGLARIREAFASGFNAATLFTTVFDLTLDKQALKKRPPSQTTPAPLSHDRDKKRLIGTAGKAYLHALNITNDKGVVFKNAQDKYRQINKYVEILGGLLQGIAPDRLKKCGGHGSLDSHRGGIS